MKFVSDEENPDQQELIERLDDAVQTLVHLDMAGRKAAVEGNQEIGTEVAMRVGSIMADLTWGGIPTLMMHMAHHVGMARMDAGRMAATCEASANGLTRVSQVMSEAGAPIELCVQLMDLAVELRKAADDCLFEPSDCGDEGQECTHG